MSHLPDKLDAISAKSIARNAYSSPNGPEHRCLIVVLCPDLERREEEEICNSINKIRFGAFEELFFVFFCCCPRINNFTCGCIKI